MSKLEIPAPVKKLDEKQVKRELKKKPKVKAIIKNLMETAECLFDESKTGAEKKAWVKEQALMVLNSVNIKWLPDSIEPALKEAFVTIAIEVLWFFTFRLRKKKVPAVA